MAARSDRNCNAAPRAVSSRNNIAPILPGSAIGVLGSGQLGRMFAIAARRMGYRVHTLSPDEDTPTGQVADLEVNAPYEDLDAICRFASGVSVVTFEFENVPAETAAAAARCAPVRPSGHVLHTTQHRLREKTFLVRSALASSISLAAWRRRTSGPSFAGQTNSRKSVVDGFTSPSAHRLAQLAKHFHSSIELSAIGLFAETALFDCSSIIAPSGRWIAVSSTYSSVTTQPVDAVSRCRHKRTSCRP